MRFLLDHLVERPMKKSLAMNFFLDRLNDDFTKSFFSRLFTFQANKLANNEQIAGALKTCSNEQIYSLAFINPKWIEFSIELLSQVAF